MFDEISPVRAVAVVLCSTLLKHKILALWLPFDTCGGEDPEETLIGSKQNASRYVLTCA